MDTVCVRQLGPALQHRLESLSTWVLSTVGMVWGGLHMLMGAALRRERGTEGEGGDGRQSLADIHRGAHERESDAAGSRDDRPTEPEG